MTETESFFDGKIVLHAGDCLDVLKTLEPNSIDSVVTDPPYGLAFMGKSWDHGVPGVAYWKAAYRVLKPGGHVVAFSGTRTYHRMACAIEDAGFEIRDMLSWMYGSGFPKSLDVSKAIDKMHGAERQVIPTGAPVKRMIPGADQHKAGWEKNNGRVYVPGDSEPATDAAKQWDGYGTALKPACEPICLARKPPIGTVAENVLRHGTGALNIDGCRVAHDEECKIMQPQNHRAKEDRIIQQAGRYKAVQELKPNGRWPANVIHDGSDEVVGVFPETTSGAHNGNYTRHTSKTKNTYGERAAKPEVRDGDSGSAARFFYTAKADADDRLGSKHPTVKPLDLMQWLVRLVTPKGGLVLDPFAGTGTTGEAAFREGMRAVLIEREEEYQADIRRRMALCMSGTQERKREGLKARFKDKPEDHGPLFGSAVSP